jgi:hypothetical protein
MSNQHHSAPPADGSDAHTDGRDLDGVDVADDVEADDVDDVDEQFRALLEGLRTSLPGVQVLFAFLLTAPLQGRFEEFDVLERAAFGVAFYASGLASILLIAPSVHQRVRAPASGIQRHSRRHLIIATWITIVGTVVMGVAIVATTFVVSSFVFGHGVAYTTGAIIAGVATWAWCFVPLVTFRRR